MEHVRIISAILLCGGSTCMLSRLGWRVSSHMKISIEGKIDIWIGLVSLAGAGAALIVPSTALPTVGVLLVVIAIALGLLLLTHQVCDWVGWAWNFDHAFRIGALWLTLIYMFFLFYCLSIYISSNEQVRHAPFVHRIRT